MDESELREAIKITENRSKTEFFFFFSSRVKRILEER